MTIAEILSKAADLIEPEEAWAGHDCGGGQNCTATAIWAANGNFGNSRPTMKVQQFFARHIGVDPSKVPRSIYRWNDAPERTQSEVVSKLREAADLAREKGL